MKENEKMQKFIILAIVCIAILLISLIAYSLNSRSKSNSQAEVDIGSESASTKIGKSTDEAKNELSKEDEFETATLIEKSDEPSKESIEENKEQEKTQATTTVEPSEKGQEKKEETKQPSKSTEITFSAPVKGAIIREFARESLVYSNTLKEWITHNGVDIKADKTTVVSSCADGTVYAIKTDPRYGLTVIINHDNGYQTIYSNLLTSEFVVEGEKVTAGQSIGTVGNSASFEVLDEYHLHFELLQNGEYLDPTIYMSFE